MKIAIVLNTSWNIYNFRKGLVQSLISSGYEVVAIAPEDNYTQSLLDMGCQYEPIKLENKGSNPLKDLQYTRNLYKIYKRIKPDVVLQFTIKPNIYGTLAAKMLKIPIVNNVCGLGTVFLRDGLSSRIAKSLYKLSFKFPDKVFFQNEDDRSLFLDKKLIKKKITDLVPGSGIPLDRFEPRPFYRNKTFNFLMISRLLYDKGIVEYVSAAKILKAKGILATFQVLGKIDESHKLGVSKEEVGMWVKDSLIDYLGTTDSVADVIAKADAVVLPSYREGTPRALLEAASMAKPLIATDIAGCRQTIDNGQNGFLCELKSANDLADKMQKMTLLSDKELKSMGQKSREKVESEFDENIVIKKYLSTILDIKEERKIIEVI